MSSADVTEEHPAQRERKHLWKPGQSGNAKGRPRGSRSKLGEHFIQDLYQAWTTQGNDVIQRVIDDRPQDFLKIIANILPKDVNLKVSSTEDLSDEQLLRKLAALTEMARPLLARITDGTAVGVDVRVEPAVDVEYTEISSG